MGFFEDLFGGDGKKNKTTGQAGGGGGPPNPFAKIGKKQGGFNGAGQSLGGSKPGVVISIVLPNPGPLGIRVEKKSNNSASAIVNEVVRGSQAETAGLQRGDVLCFSGSNGQDEVPYDMFLKLAQAQDRPIHLEARRFTASASSSSSSAAVRGGAGNSKSTSADAEARRKAVVAAAEARDKAHKAKSKPIRYVTKSTLQQQAQSNQSSEASEAPLSEASRVAAAMAKQDEANLAAQLGYNPYETAKSTAGQARTATTTVQHGNMATTTDGDDQGLPSVAPPANPTSAVEDNSTTAGLAIPVPPDFEEALITVLSSMDTAAAQNSLSIVRKLMINAITKGQQPGDDAAKFRKVRLANAKIKAAIVDVSGSIDLMLMVGFSLEETDGESCLLYPADYSGPEWLPTALQRLEEAMTTSMKK